MPKLRISRLQVIVYVEVNEPVFQKLEELKPSWKNPYSMKGKGTFAYDFYFDCQNNQQKIETVEKLKGFLK